MSNFWDQLNAEKHKATSLSIFGNGMGCFPRSYCRCKLKFNCGRGSFSKTGAETICHQPTTSRHVRWAKCHVVSSSRKPAKPILPNMETIFDTGSSSCHAQSPIKSPLLHWKTDPLLIVVCSEIHLRGRIFCNNRIATCKVRDHTYYHHVSNKLKPKSTFHGRPEKAARFLKTR